MQRLELFIPANKDGPECFREINLVLTPDEILQGLAKKNFDTKLEHVIEFAHTPQSKLVQFFKENYFYRNGQDVDEMTLWLCLFLYRRAHQMTSADIERVQVPKEIVHPDIQWFYKEMTAFGLVKSFLPWWVEEETYTKDLHHNLIITHNPPFEWIAHFTCQGAFHNLNKMGTDESTMNVNFPPYSTLIIDDGD